MEMLYREALGKVTIQVDANTQSEGQVGWSENFEEASVLE